MVNNRHHIPCIYFTSSPMYFFLNVHLWSAVWGDLVVAYLHVYYDDRFLEICGYDNEQSNCLMAICCHRSAMAITVMMSPSLHNK